VIGLYAPFNLQRRLAMGLIIPIVYFSVRALEDYWFYRVAEQWRAPAMIALIVFIVPTNIFMLGIPLFGVVYAPDSGLDKGLLLETEYWNTFEWLNSNGQPDAVVLASPNVSLWIPAYTEEVVVYGHPYETVPNDVRLKQVEDFYRGLDCQTLLSDQLPFVVRYIMWGPQEERFAQSDEDGATFPNAGKCITEIPLDRIEQKVEKGEGERQVTTYVIRQP
jgi:hypothetical protein